MVFSPATTRGGVRFKAAKRARIYVSLAPTCFASQWLGCSRQMIEWPFVDAPQTFSIQDLTAFAASSYILVVRTKGVRYKFWEGVGEVMTYPLYNGETLYDDAVFELWSTPTTSGNFPGFQFYLPTVHENCDCTTQLTERVLAAVVPGRAQFCSAPVHTTGGPPHPTIVFSITTPLC